MLSHDIYSQPISLSLHNDLFGNYWIPIAIDVNEIISCTAAGVLHESALYVVQNSRTVWIIEVNT